MTKLTTKEMLEALERLPEDEKGWSDVQRALAPNASDRTIEKAFKKRCPEAKDPDLMAWQRYNQAQQQIRSIREEVDHYWSDSDLGLFGAAQAATEEEKAAFEEFKKDSESRIKELSEICKQNEEGYKRWCVVTHTSIF